MNIATYIQIEIIPLFTLALTLYISAMEFKAIKNIRRFQCLVILIMCIIAIDAFNWYTVEKPMAMPIWLLWLSNTLYFLLTEVISYLWFLYVIYQVYGNELPANKRLWIRLSLVPLFIVCLIIAGSPWNKLVFTLDPVTQVYARGPLHIIQTVTGFSYMLLASVLAFVQSKRVTLNDDKKECRFLCSIVILPFVGGIVQIINYSFVFLWSFTAAAALLIFIDFQSHRISVDALTNLNNRRNLERYLQTMAGDHKLCGYVMMMDINRFKQINDKFGHIEGDRALKLVAHTLKMIFGATDAFIARYGGDEFVVVADVDDPEKYIKRCNDELKIQAAEALMPFELSLSVGHARCGRDTNESPKELMQMADMMMYERKRGLHADG